MKNNSQNLRYGAVYTLYKPPADFLERIRSVIETCDAVILVDNTPGGAKIEINDSKIVLLQDGGNKGIASALNMGISKARECDVNFLVLFDQDSSPDTDTLKKLFVAASKHRKALIGPLFVDDQVGLIRSAVETDEYSPVGCLPTSGMTFNLDDMPADMRFNEQFFLDFVDFDWCWRLSALGWTCLLANQIPMRHRLGLAQRKFLFITYHVPEPYRHYFQFRDAIKLTSLSYVPLYSKFRLTLIILPKLVVYPFLLGSGIERLKWMIRGLYDAVRNVGGIGAAKKRLS
jgi:rhamnosyltransferase